MIQAASPATRRWLRALLIAAAVVAVSLGALLWILLAYRPHPAIANCSGSPTMLGQQQGQAFNWRVPALLRFYVLRIVCAGDRHRLAARAKQAAPIWQTLPPPYAAELQALAQATAVPADQLLYANALLDLGNTSAGCRSVVTTNAQSLWHSHNLDWENLGGLAKLSTTIVRRAPDDGRHHTVSVGFPGLIGAFDIINEHGIALSFNQLGFGNGLPTTPLFIHIRRIAETTASFERACAQIEALPAGMPFIITISAAKEHHAAIFERKRDQISRRDLHHNPDAWVAACNTAQAQTYGQTILDQALAARSLHTQDDLIAILGDPKVVMSANIYSVIFDYHANELLLSSGLTPAAQHPFRSYVLFPE